MTNRFTWVVVTGVAAICGALQADQPATKQSPDAPQAAGTSAEATPAPVTEQMPDQRPQTALGEAALQQAAKADKYLFALFRKADDDRTLEMRQTLTAAMMKIADRAQSVEVDVTAESERAIVDRFRLQYAPMPLLLAIAPNGVITGGFPVRVSEESLLDAFATPRTTELLKALEQGKLVFLCVQNADSESRKQAMRGVRKFKRDPRFAQDTVTVNVDPADAAEKELLESLQIDPQTPEAVTVFFGPRGSPIGMFHGATTLEELVHTLSTCGFG